MRRVRSQINPGPANRIDPKEQTRDHKQPRFTSERLEPSHEQTILALAKCRSRHDRVPHVSSCNVNSIRTALWLAHQRPGAAWTGSIATLSALRMSQWLPMLFKIAVGKSQAIHDRPSNASRRSFPAISSSPSLPLLQSRPSL